MDNIAHDLIFNAGSDDFVARALSLYHFQVNRGGIFGRWVQQNKLPGEPSTLTACSFLPISFFKTHEVTVQPAKTPEIIFTSSGTTGLQTSKHLVYNPVWYEQCFTAGWQHFYSAPEQTAFFCLLPSYMERSGSSLIYMMEKLVKMNSKGLGGFYLHHNSSLSPDMQQAAESGHAVVLFGVSFALLDFALQQPTPIPGIVMDTGGMKGRKNEMTRPELHEQLRHAFSVAEIASEYGMTELMSQAYSKGGGIYHCPPWMRVLVRDEADPRLVSLTGQGMLCVIDLANKDSCAFIETQDVGKVYADGSFEVLGRMDSADLRGCNLLVA